MLEIIENCLRKTRKKILLIGSVGERHIHDGSLVIIFYSVLRALGKDRIAGVDINVFKKNLSSTFYFNGVLQDSM